jgi:dTMP kinase
MNKNALAAGNQTLESIKMRGQRGMLIVFEGLDRSGKSTQVKLLHEALNSMNRQCEVWRYPNRTTNIGKLINSYLNKEIEMEDHAVHLLFSANRWETVGEMTTALNSGTNLILDR